MTRLIPTFETDRLLIRPRSMVDLDDCLAMDRDPAVTQFIPGPWSDSVAHRKFVIDRIQKNYPSGMGYWSVFEKSGQSGFIGWIILIPYTNVSNEVEIGWRFIRKSWGRGYATESAKLILDYGFSEPGLKKVVADIHPSNISSIRVAEKLGFKYVEDRSFGDVKAKSFQIKKADIEPHEKNT